MHIKLDETFNQILKYPKDELFVLIRECGKATGRFKT